MDWTSGDPLAALVTTRALHFCATAVVAGAVLFRAVVAGPAAAAAPSARAVVDQHMRAIATSALAVAIASGVAWFMITAAEMGNLPLSGALDRDVLRIVLQGTQFGSIAATRLSLALLVGVGLAFDAARRLRVLTLLAALGLAASIAWTGHAGSGFGTSGNLQLAADAMHILAASAWIGGLVPLALLLSFASKRSDSLMEIASAVVRRFSILGIISVATLIASGAVNAWFLVGSLKALTGTEYGRVLMLKLLLFAVMLGIAAVNRNVLTPQLGSTSADGGAAALAKLIRHCGYEIVLGFAVISVVGWLGTLHPAAHFMN